MVTKILKGFENWDVSRLTNMSALFKTINKCQTFNGDLSEWDVSAVTDISNMFVAETSQSVRSPLKV